jgi:hypothetical protein
MWVTQTHQSATGASIRVTTRVDDADCRVTRVRVNGRVDVGTLDRWLIFWTAGREVRVGPLTRDQAEKLAEDLAYDAI